MIKKERLKEVPQLRVAVTPRCNLACSYCRPGGEGYYQDPKSKMRTKEILKIIRLCSEVGFRNVKFTGGEPLLREDIFEIVSKANNISGIRDVQLVTNGTLLKNKVVQLKQAGIDLLTVSLDATSESSLQEIEGTKPASIIRGLQKCKIEGLPTRINMVVMKSNFDQIEPMIRLCEGVEASLKLLDLIYLEKSTDFNYWQEEYIHFDAVRDLLKSKGAKSIGLEKAPGGIGAPLEEFKTQTGVQVVLKDSTRGVFYNEKCKKCKLYPCQDGVISVRVTHDGKLKRCLVRNDNLIPLLEALRKEKTEHCKKLIQNVFAFMVSSSFHPKKWSPQVVIKRSKAENE